ncbi:sulfotransferase family protein [Idiomarina zobellii]|uniref:Sulfotransferase family protein n=1 Tax=Idiomarina zobellii TaxID=86103 RepID=A0A837NB53_9GAMM|nr:sulfotransferase [Idiomarina zobellii]KPD22106.1 hypothetical protein AFK76_11305 [Idiomarina zobellii]SDG22953.1 Sulfotransferase family protein [Idiomarina zobellii]
MHRTPPFFILGNPRSGTSLFRLMLNNHPKIAVPPECGFCEWLYEEFAGTKLNIKIYGDFLRKVFSTKKFETWELDFDEVFSLIIENKPTTYQELVLEIYRAYANKANKKAELFGDKNNYYISRVRKLEKIFPECRKIFIVRDGRDVACSYLDLSNKKLNSRYKPNLTADIKDIAEEWKKSVEVMLQWVNKGAIYIRYEDLVNSPINTLKEVCDFLSVTFSEEMLAFYKNNDEPNEFKGWKDKTFMPLADSSVGRYKRDLSEKQLIDFESVASDRLELLGYSL